jgi:hypothetical protein
MRACSIRVDNEANGFAIRENMGSVGRVKGEAVEKYSTLK